MYKLRTLSSRTATGRRSIRSYAEASVVAWKTGEDMSTFCDIV